MLEPTKVGRFGECSIMRVAEDQAGVFKRVLESLDQPQGVTALGADAGTVFGSARVGLVASAASDLTGKDDSDNGRELMFTALFLSDQDDDDTPPYPKHGPWGAEIQDVEFMRLMSAIGEALPGSHEFLYRCDLSTSTDQAQFEFPLPISLWRSKRPFGSLVGARFALEQRGARGGWIALDINEDEATASLHFWRNTRLDDGDMVEKAWTFIRRIYDNVLVLDDAGGGVLR